MKEMPPNVPPQHSADILNIDDWRSFKDWQAVVARREGGIGVVSFEEQIAERQARLNLTRAEQDFDTLYEQVRNHLMKRADSGQAGVDINRLFNNLAYIKEIAGGVPPYIYRKMEKLQKEVDARNGGPDVA
jgi:hypothetical protein